MQFLRSRPVDDDDHYCFNPTLEITTYPNIGSMISVLELLLRTWCGSAVSWKIISFALVGICNTVVDFAAFTFAYEILTLSLVASNVMAWLVAVTFSYVLNTLTTFHRETGRVLRRNDYLNFVASGVLGVIATTTTLVVLSSYLHVMIAKLASILVGFIVNFTMSNFFVFRRRKR